MSDLYVNQRLTIPSREITITAARSSGPGGQNVNKVNSKVTLRWSPGKCELITPAWQSRFISRFSNRINREGQLILHSEKYRDQGRNLADVRQKLVDLLIQCQAAPNIRRPTKRTKGSQRRRLDKKKELSQKKQGRRSNWKAD